jgi:hypothetical protein
MNDCGTKSKGTRYRLSLAGVTNDGPGLQTPQHRGKVTNRKTGHYTGRGVLVQYCGDQTVDVFSDGGGGGEAWGFNSN